MTDFNTNYACSRIILRLKTPKILGSPPRPPLRSLQRPQTNCCFVTYMSLTCVFYFTKTDVPKYFCITPLRMYIPCFKNTHKRKQKANETNEEKRKTNENKEEKKERT